jgi:hypothetical protein
MPEGFDDNAYTLTLFPDNARFALLYGGGPTGEALNVVALTRNEAGSAASPLVQLREDGIPRLVSGTDSDASLDHVRRFRVLGLASGEAFLHALTADGRAYCNPARIKVGADRGDLPVMQRAFDASVQSRRKTAQALQGLDRELRQVQLRVTNFLSGENPALYDFMQRRFRVPPFNRSDKAALARTRNVIAQVILKIDTSLRLGASARLMRSSEDIGGRASTDTSFGIECGQFFFERGPNCQHTILLHELFHVAGAGHGQELGKPVPPLTDMNSITSPELALNSADNLAAFTLEMGAAEVFDPCVQINN